jgi:hypothetical protein
MNQTDQIISNLLNNLKTDLINSLQAKGTTATQTINQIQITTDGDNQQLQIPGYLQVLETGRGPTPKNAPPGNPPMIQRIQQWCRDKGIPDKAAWAIKKKIDKVGYPAKPGILTDALGDDNINTRLNQSSTQIADSITDQILNSLTL